MRAPNREREAHEYQPNHIPLVRPSDQQSSGNGTREDMHAVPRKDGAPRPLCSITYASERAKTELFGPLGFEAGTPLNLIKRGGLPLTLHHCLDPGPSPRKLPGSSDSARVSAFVSEVNTNPRDEGPRLIVCRHEQNAALGRKPTAPHRFREEDRDTRIERVGLSNGSSWKQLLRDASDYGARVCDEDFHLVPVAINGEESLR